VCKLRSLIWAIDFDPMPDKTPFHSYIKISFSLDMSPIYQKF
jgi:hypothetical protein